MKKKSSLLSLLITGILSLSACSLQDLVKKTTGGGSEQKQEQKTDVENKDPVLSFSFEDVSGSRTKDKASGKDYKIDYVFSE